MAWPASFCAYLAAMQLPPLVLGSKSPRRQQLLAAAGFRFRVQVQDVEEVWPPHLPLAEIPAYLARLKAEALEPLSQDELVITADTTVILGQQVLNKPTSAEEAIQMLLALSGQCHTVVTGVHLRYRGRQTEFSAHTRVYFRPLELEEITQYVAQSPPLDRAGAYGIQDTIGLRGIRRIEGDYYNVMGLPVCQLVEALQQYR